MADTKKISELNSTSNLANEDEFVVIDKNGTGSDSSSSGKTSKIRFDDLKNQIGSQGEKGQKGEANKGQKGEASKGQKGEASKGQKGEASKGQKGEASKGQKGEPLEFNDLSSTQRNQIKGQKGEANKGQKGEVGPKLTFNDLSTTEKTSLKGKKGEPLEFTDLTSTQKTSLKGAPGAKLAFNDLSTTDKNSLKGVAGDKGTPGAKLTFNDLSSTEKTSLKGQKGEVDQYATSKSLFYWNANALVGKSTDIFYKINPSTTAWDAGVWSKKSHTNGASISFKVGSRMYAKKPIFIIGFTSSSNRSEPAPGSYFDYGIYYHGVNNKLYAKKGTGNSVDRTLPTNGGTFTLTYDAKNVRLYVGNALWFTWNTDLDKTFSMKASLLSPVNPTYTYGGNTYLDPIVHDVQFSSYGASGDDGQKGEPGAAGPNDITNKAITSNATSSWTGNPGSQGKIQYHSNRWYIVSDKASNRIVQFRRDGSDKSYIDNNGKFVGTATSAESAVSAGNSVKLDGLPVTSFVRTNASSNVSADTEWQDNKSIYLGNSADYRIYHNSNNHTYFNNRNHGAGTYFQSENSAGTNVGHLYLEGGTRPYVRLLESGSERLRTTSAGVEINKNLTITRNDTTNEGGEIRLQTSDGGQMFIDAYGKGNDSKVRIHSNGKTYLEMGPSGIKLDGNLVVTGTVNAPQNKVPTLVAKGTVSFSFPNKSVTTANGKFDNVTNVLEGLTGKYTFKAGDLGFVASTTGGVETSTSGNPKWGGTTTTTYTWNHNVSLNQANGTWTSTRTGTVVYNTAKPCTFEFEVYRNM